MIYSIDSLKKTFKEQNKFNATIKPRYDTSDSILDLGGEVIWLYDEDINNHCKLFRIYKRIVSFLSAYYRIRNVKNSIVLIQIPIFNNIIKRLLPIIRKKRNRIVFLIHDLDNLRFCHNNADVLSLLNRADALIAHSQNMMTFLRECGYNGFITTLGCFDYRSSISHLPARIIRNDDIKLVFAGNLGKSKFLSRLTELTTDSHFQIYLYGVGLSESLLADNIFYKGKFEPEQIDLIEGNWGLVWDGDSIDTCTGVLGSYLKFIAPFKLGMYVAANMPVVVWKDSAMAEFVMNNSLGICVNSLHDIKSTINNLSESDIEKITNGVSHYSSLLRNGHNFKVAFSHIMSLLK